MTDDNDYLKALAYLKAQCSINGVAAIRFKDGQMFMFTRDTINNIVDQMDNKKSDEAIVFVHTGQVLQDT